ncbi:hypothetical protein KC614_00670 [candidate division WWE3 bacterium]|uniref:Elongation factor P C-terminal domain-containing protein n=1 Tax=candidate division WWE3 bacterium TaxID=2053526 RepID=A0A955LK17_UNCKA|nr:hypothetical protein [candidate division WWE3 bacterium]
MIAVNDLRQGTLFNMDGNIYQVIDFKRHKMARAKAVVNVKVRDIQTSGIRELTFKSSDSVAEADVKTSTLEFVYADERKGKIVLSEPQTKRRYEVGLDSIGENDRLYLKSGTEIVAYTGINDAGELQIYTVSLPNTVDLEVTQAPPNDKGDTASGGTKPVVCETGVVVNTPFFIKDGDVVRVNTQTGSYVERVSS